MRITLKSLAALAVGTLLLSGCAGVRNSYEALIVPEEGKPVIRLAVKSERELLVIGNGFPGWWGYYPGIISHVPEVAEVRCLPGRSWIPFREPGLLFGGERCDLVAQKTGVAWLLLGNSFTLGQSLEKIDLSAYATGKEFPPSPKTSAGSTWIKVIVTAAGK